MIKKIFLLLFCLFFASSAFAATQYYYLRTTGAGSNSGDTGTWNVVPSSDANAMSANNFNDSRNWSTTDSASKLDPDDVVYVKGSWGSNSKYDLIINNGGITLDFYESGDYDPETMSHTIEPVFWNSIDIKSDDVTIQDGRFRNAARSIHADDAFRKYQRIKILRNYFDCSEAWSWSSIRFGFVCDSEIAYNQWEGAPQDECCYVLPCTDAPKGRGFTMNAGSRNKIHHNTVKGGHVGMYFPGAMTWDNDLYTIDYPSSGSYAIDPDVNYEDNEISHNKIERRCQEGISIDISAAEGQPWGFSNVERDTVASVSGTTVTLNNSGGEWTGVGNKWSGLYMIAITNEDDVYGNHALIEAQSANTFTLSNAITNLQVGDKVIIGFVARHNWIHDNTWGIGGYAGSSMLIEGSGLENLIERNSFPLSTENWDAGGYGVAVKALYGHVISPYSVTQEPGAHVTAYNITRENTMGRILNMAHDKNYNNSEDFTIRNNAFYDNTFHVNETYPRTIILRRANAYLKNNKYKGGGDVTVDTADGLSGTRATDPTGFVSNYFANWGSQNYKKSSPTSLRPPQNLTAR